MYLRTTKRKNKDGSVIEYYHLAHNVRHPDTKQSTPNIIHTFGRADQLDRDQLVRLCRSIARVCGLDVIDPVEYANENKQCDPVKLFDGVKIIKTLSFGRVHFAEILWERIGIGKTLREIFNRHKVSLLNERALLAMTANRLCEPESKLGVWDRWLKKVYMPSCKGLGLDRMYEAMDHLHKHAEEVEQTVFWYTANLFNRDVDLVFYDTTSASFHIDYEDDGDDGLRKFGHAKEGNWAPQVVVALAVTPDGLPVRSWVFPGNTSDVETIKQVRTDLRGWNLHRALFIADSGVNSRSNRKELARACGKYLLATRMANVKEVREEVLSKKGRYISIKENLKAKEVIVGDGMRRRRYVLCYNPKEAERSRKHRQQMVEFLENELSKHKDHSATAKWAIDLLASKRFKRYLSITKGNKIRIDRAKIKEAQRYDGKWVIETNDDSISIEDAACGYRSLMVIERCFRSLKRTRIKMTPMYHWLPRRIEAHVKICVLSLLIERIAENMCSKSWHEIGRCLDEIQVTEFQTNTHRFFRINELRKQVKDLLKALGINTPKLLVDIKKLS
jgi:transposase